MYVRFNPSRAAIVESYQRISCYVSYNIPALLARYLPVLLVGFSSFCLLSTFSFCLCIFGRNSPGLRRIQRMFYLRKLGRSRNFSTPFITTAGSRRKRSPSTTCICEIKQNKTSTYCTKDIKYYWNSLFYLKEIKHGALLAMLAHSAVQSSARTLFTILFCS